MIVRKRPREKYLRRLPRSWSDLREYRRRVLNRRKAQAKLESIDMARTFTVAEAQTLLPVLESLLRSAMEAKALIEQVDGEMQSLANRIFINGGTLVNIVSVARRKAERDKAEQRAKDAVAEIDATGVQVKDLDIGLLDFPCVVGDDIILLSSAGKRFGPKLLFDNLDWLITPHDRVGLVGANGTGKSTLLKILGGMESLDYGSMTAARNTTFGYLPQDGLQLSGRTVFDECMSVFSGLRALEQEMEDLAHKMGELDPTSTEYAQVADRYQRISGEFHMNDGYALDSQVGTVLDGLGFRKEDWTRYTEEFSGGWQMRIALAKLLLAKPNLLLLDEPTNHLDLETRNWLEQYLLEYPYAYVLISHDRYFLDVTVDRIVEIWNKRVQFYSGNYEKYLQQKQERRDSLVAAYKNQ